MRVLRRCAEDEPNLRGVQSEHGAACHQIPGFDAAEPIVPRSQHRRSVTPVAVEEVRA